jgi:hypothetical protein
MSNNKSWSYVASRFITLVVPIYRVCVPDLSWDLVLWLANPLLGAWAGKAEKT